MENHTLYPSPTWTACDLNGRPVMPEHTTNVGNWLHEYAGDWQDDSIPRFFRIK